ncbi:TIGR03767 family metallophosphoesterase [Amycolatopsis sp. NBC_00438]|uniref:TIGR03767 family metallophosphoesterase n=1 Tax=Amycolatopsis sp. NBC_00438 TaxID=2903558 RepID=UPI002E1EFC83
MDTTRRRIVRAEAGELGYRRLAEAPGEPHAVREDLAPASPSRAGTPLARFAHLSDLHVMDAQSPTRVEYLERHADPDSPLRPYLPLIGTYRPQDVFTTHVVEAMVRAVNESDVDFAVSTGDATDACQANELRAYLGTLDGGPVDPDSGKRGHWEGVHASDPATYDVRYWHPDGTPEGCEDDHARARYGFPEAPGALDAAARPFEATGLRVPWYAVYGNHDNMLQGVVPPWPELADVTVGGDKLTALPEGDVVELLHGFDQAERDVVARLLDGATVPVTPDPERRHVSRAEWIGAHVDCHGHGYVRANAESDTAYYAFDHGVLRCLVLDTVNPHGFWQGSLDVPQFEWLRAELAASADRLVVLFSHHPLDTLVNDHGPDRRVLADELAALLHASPNVVLWVNGHTHENKVTPQATFWEVTTASHIDWPQQARLVEVRDNADGTLSIVVTIVDHSGPVTGGGDDPIGLAGLSRELSANYWQHRDGPERGAGTAADRNVELLLRDPRPNGW